MKADGTIGAIVYDLRASGVVRNLLRIAQAALDRGLEFEIWPLRPQGEFLREAEEIAALRPILTERSGGQRDLDCLFHQTALGEALAMRAPSLVFSAGNQMHWHLAKAMRYLPTDKRPRFIGRASNAVVSASNPNAVARALIRPQEQFQYCAMDHIIAVSVELRNQLVDELHISTERVSTIPNGIDVNRFVDHDLLALKERACDGGDPVILGIGRLSRQKDFVTLIDSVGMLRGRSRPALRILGRGSKPWQKRLRKQAERRGIADRFELLGHVENVAEHLVNADLFVSSSRWEGASNVVLEAMACGTPIVATDAPTGIREVLAPLGEEAIVPVGDSHALAMAIEKRLAAPRAAGASIARAHNFDLNQGLADYCSVFTEQLNLASHRYRGPAGKQGAH
tara:strand:+ start:4683 stop:5873 length:1191 start_codon:yes stop_codon:yes gene_type:complete